MKYLVTGADGFIGRHLVEYLARNKKDTIIATDRTTKVYFEGTNIQYQACELKDKEQVDKLEDVDKVIHLAAYNGTKFFYEKPFEVIKDNIIPTLNLLDRYKNGNVEFIYSGSPESTTSADLPAKEDAPYFIPDPLNPRWSYANSKALGEQAVIHSGLKWKIIRYNNVYGPGQKDHFIPEFVDRLKQTNEAKLYGYANTRTFLFVEDACEATYEVMEHMNCEEEIINIGGAEELKIHEVANIICDLVDYRGVIVGEPAPEGSVTRRWPDISKLKLKTGWFPKTSLRAGLAKTLGL